MTPQGARARAYAPNQEVAAFAGELVRQSASRCRSTTRWRPDVLLRRSVRPGELGPFGVDQREP